MGVQLVAGGCGREHSGAPCAICAAAMRSAKAANLAAAAAGKPASKPSQARAIKPTRVELAPGAAASHLVHDGTRMGEPYTFRLCRDLDSIFGLKAMLRLGFVPGVYHGTCTNCFYQGERPDGRKTGRFGGTDLGRPERVAAARAEIERENAAGMPLTAAEVKAGITRPVATPAAAPEQAPVAHETRVDGPQTADARYDRLERLVGALVGVVDTLAHQYAELSGRPVAAPVHVHQWAPVQWACECGQTTDESPEPEPPTGGSALAGEMRSEVERQAEQIVNGRAVPDTNDGKDERRAARQVANRTLSARILRENPGVERGSPEYGRLWAAAKGRTV